MRKEEVSILHSKEDSKEMATEIVLNGTITLGAHTYTSNWVIGDHISLGSSVGTIMGANDDAYLPTLIWKWKYYFEQEMWFGKNKGE